MKRCVLRRAALGSVVAVLTACGTVSERTPEPGAPTESLEAESTPVASTRECVPVELVGTYRRQLTSADTDDSGLHGNWTLTIEPCTYVIAVEGVEQGGGRLELVEGTVEAGRLGLSQDLGCPNEFTGTGFYDFTLAGSSLTFREAIAASDACEGRAAALGGSPSWSR